MSAINVTITDSFSLSDGTSRLAPGVGPILSDTLVFSELLQVSMILRLSLSETLNFLDSVAVLINKGNLSTDTLSFSDTVATVLTAVLTKTVYDTLSFTDAVETLISDTFNSYIRRYLNDINL